MKKILYTMLLSVILLSCSDDDDVEVNPLVGSWELMAVDNEAVYDAPEDEEIVITFKEREYIGETSVNEFGGDYEIVSNRLLLTNSYTSEIGETAWGNLFYEGIRNAYDEEEERSEFTYTIQGDTLTSRSTEDIMIFTRFE
ncbi:hypothetical protein GCM10007103_28410 [Salinimicrobium marinum]|uniref:Lipocalin-like domain-containing protein n=1 Tax=Salinimicrobium marinum TaxID=680283 RepID=A0A918SIK8_9FLAO|nr:hypothetical protein [Salinimicrobium marinum]GHA45647.1 hypothetical protein GCM10007103_28410 [Salinimicrobium marinum]